MGLIRLLLEIFGLESSSSSNARFDGLAQGGAIDAANAAIESPIPVALAIEDELMSQPRSSASAKIDSH